MTRANWTLKVREKSSELNKQWREKRTEFLCLMHGCIVEHHRIQIKTKIFSLNIIKSI